VSCVWNVRFLVGLNVWLGLQRSWSCRILTFRKLIQNRNSWFIGACWNIKKKLLFTQWRASVRRRMYTIYSVSTSVAGHTKTVKPLKFEVSTACTLVSESMISTLSHHILAFGLRADSTDFLTEPVLWAFRLFVFLFFLFYFITLLFFFGSVRQIKLAIRQLSGARNITQHCWILVTISFHLIHETDWDSLRQTQKKRQLA